MKKDFFIRILEFGDRHPEGFGETGIIMDEQLNLNDWEETLVRHYIQSAQINAVNDTLCETPFLLANKQHNRFIISMEARFKYIDYLELRQAVLNSEQANANALKANKHAITAIILTIIAILASIFFSYKQLNSNPKLNEGQFQEIKELINNLPTQRDFSTSLEMTKEELE